MLAPGDYMGRYRVESVLGQGGMAIVYKVRHADDGKNYAIKVLAVRSADVQRRLVAEGKTQSKLKHPNVVAVHHILKYEDNPVLVMEFVDGPSLHELMQTPMPHDEAVYMFRAIVAGVAAAHAKGIIHRDLKPANILLAIGDDEIVPKVSDFGLVKTLQGKGLGTRPGEAMGTPQYMAPEQVRDASSVDQRADLFSLGVILYELVCHKRPFDGPNMVAVLNVVMVGAYTPPEELVPNLPPEIIATIGALLTKKPETRLQSCEEILAVLDGAPVPERAAARDSTAPKKPDAKVAAAQTQPGSEPPVLAFAAAGMLVLAGLAAVLFLAL